MSMEEYIAAIDLGGTTIKSALVAPSGQILEKHETPTEANHSRDTVIQNILKAVEKVHRPGLIGIGVGSPGCVNADTGEVHWIENIPCLNGVSVTAEIKKQYDLPVYIDNDATNAAKGMYRFGAGKGSAHMIGITLGTGVGGGIILHGLVHRGIINYAGEIGHITYIPDGMSCTCGKRGCLEAYASATAIVRSAQSILKRQIPSRLQKYPADEITARVVCDEARQGCSVSASIIQDAGKALGVVIGGVINLLNLDRVVIGGGLAAAGEVLMEPVRLYASRHALPLAFERCEIVAGRLGNDAGLLGCAASVLMARDGTNHLSS